MRSEKVLVTGFWVGMFSRGGMGNEQGAINNIRKYFVSESQARKG